MDDPLRNKKDPLHKAGPEAGKELFRHFSQVAHGFPKDAVMDAAFNMIINMVRTSHDSWQKAEPLIDQIHAKVKTTLRDHYDPIGKRRNIFPFDQVIEMPFLDLRNKKVTPYD